MEYIQISEMLRKIEDYELIFDRPPTVIYMGTGSFKRFCSELDHFYMSRFGERGDPRTFEDLEIQVIDGVDIMTELGNKPGRKPRFLRQNRQPKQASMTP